MLASPPLVSKLPADAYFDPSWFEAERKHVTDTTWHRGDTGASVDTWQGLAFTSERPSTSLMDALGELPNLIGTFQPRLLTEIARVDLDGDFNWKLFIENHVDVLHLWFLHEDSLGDFDHAAFEHQEAGANWASYEPYRSSVNPDASLNGTPVRHLDERDRNGLGAHLLFPDTPMAAASNFFATYRARPIAPDRTTIELRVHAEVDADPTPIVRDIRAFIEEDMDACERIQHAVRSNHFEVGPLAQRHEAPVVRFQENLLALMDGELT